MSMSACQLDRMDGTNIWELKDALSKIIIIIETNLPTGCAPFQ